MRSKRKFTRKTGLRDAKLIIIAAEGEVTEKLYFNGIAYSPNYKNSKVHVEVLSRDDAGSDPKTCLRSLNKCKAEYSLNKNDELWLVCDVDRWGDKNLSEVNRLCHQKGYRLAVSNPCFELWLLLHHEKLSKATTADQDMLLTGCREIITRLRLVVGSYNKSNLDMNAMSIGSNMLYQRDEYLTILT